MCSFMVYTQNDIEEKDFLECFEKIGYRGPDMARTDFTNGMWGFHRLAIMGLNEKGMQPFYFKGNRVVCNGEIYGFRTLKKSLENEGYKFNSDSDCEILLPMYEKYK